MLTRATSLLSFINSKSIVICDRPRETYVNDFSLKRKNQRTTNEQRTNVPNVSTNYPNVPSIWSEKYERVKAKIHTIF